MHSFLIPNGSDVFQKRIAPFANQSINSRLNSVFLIINLQDVIRQKQKWISHPRTKVIP